MCVTITTDHFYGVSCHTHQTLDRYTSIDLNFPGEALVLTQADGSRSTVSESVCPLGVVVAGGLCQQDGGRRSDGAGAGAGGDSLSHQP